MKRLILSLVTIFVSVSTFGQACPNGTCPQIEEQVVSSVARNAISAAVQEKFIGVSEISYALGVRTDLADLADNSGSLIFRKGLRYEHVGVTIQLETGTLIDCPYAVVETSANRQATDVKLRNCRID